MVTVVCRYAWRKLGYYDRAIEDYTSSLALDRDNVKIFNNRGYCYAKKGKYHEAILDYSTVSDLNELGGNGKGFFFQKEE